MSDLTSVAEVAAQARDAVLRSVVAAIRASTPRLISPLARYSMHVYVAEEFTDAEIAVLRRYFTNLEGPFSPSSICPKS